MFCSQCGTANPDTVSLCAKCGYPLTQNAPLAGKKSSSLPILLIIGAVLFAFLTIVGILAAIAIPSFLEFQERATVARAKSDMRSMATAIEAYYVDNNRYPAWATGGDSLNNSKYPSFALYGNELQMKTLTTPVAYMTSYWPDPFAPEDSSSAGYFNYYCVEAPDDPADACWMLWSAGPDQYYDIDLSILETLTVDSLRNFSVYQYPDELTPYIFDPTNGTVSDGDVIRIKN